MIHLCPLSPQDRLNLACTVTSRAQLFDRLKGSSNPEIYSLFLRQEIEDLYGPISPKMEHQLCKIRDITSLTESLLHAKCNQKGRLLKKYHIYQPNLKQEIYRLTRHRVSLPGHLITTISFFHSFPPENCNSRTTRICSTIGHLSIEATVRR